MGGVNPLGFRPGRLTALVAGAMSEQWSLACVLTIHRCGKIHVRDTCLTAQNLLDPPYTSGCLTRLISI